MGINNLGYMTTQEAAVVLGFTPDHIRRLILDGKIKAVKLGNSWLIKHTAIKDIKRLRKSPLQESDNGTERSVNVSFIWCCESCRAFSRDGKTCEHCGATNRNRIRV